MRHTQRKGRGALEPLLVWAACVLTQPVLAQSEAPAPAPASKPAGADSSVEKLIRLMVQRKLLTESDAAELLKESQAGETPRPEQPGEVRVPYIPESVQRKITQTLEEQVVSRAKREHWAQPDTFPEWARHLTFFGDFRFREQLDRYNPGNNPFLINFQAINSGPPFDVNLSSSTVQPPVLNTTQNRQEPRIRVRFGVNAQIDEVLSTTFRFSSGNTTNPVSTNQTLGSDFNKYTFVIDQAYLNYHPWASFDASLGRIPKPWVSTNLVYWEDLSFDGLALRWHADGAFAPFVTAGIFSVENTALDFPTTRTDKVASHDKWLYAGQLGLNLKFGSRSTATLAAAYYDFANIEGRLSDPCVPLNNSDACTTDNTRPAFLQRGNTLFALRNILPSSVAPNSPLFQYFGLASPFREVDVVAAFDVQVGRRTHVVLTADYVRNLAFDAGRIAALDPVNNVVDDENGAPVWHGGGTGYQVQLLVGQPDLKQWGDWNVLGGYKHVESDATVDAFNDPDFFSINGVGGTNDKGYFVILSAGLGHGSRFSARWFSGTSVSGPPLAVDTLQLDLSAGF